VVHTQAKAGFPTAPKLGHRTESLAARQNHIGIHMKVRHISRHKTYLLSLDEILIACRLLNAQYILKMLLNNKYRDKDKDKNLRAQFL
jgi:hypothetical protein